MHSKTTAAKRSRAVLTSAASYLLLLAAALMVAAHSNAQASLTQGQQKLIALYEELLTDPTNVENTLQYAEHAVKIGDYEAAIPPLERLLITNPNATKISYELGVLYYLLGAYDISQDYFADVKKQAQSNADLAKQADAYLQRM